jgi:hypothetical protein
MSKTTLIGGKWSGLQFPGDSGLTPEGRIATLSRGGYIAVLGSVPTLYMITG